MSFLWLSKQGLSKQVSRSESNLLVDNINKWFRKNIQKSRPFRLPKEYTKETFLVLLGLLRKQTESQLQKHMVSLVSFKKAVLLASHHSGLQVFSQCLATGTIIDVI